MQYNTVVSGAMKLLNALDAFKGDAGGRRARCCAKASASCCACSTRPARTSPGRCGSELGYAAAHGDLLDAPWPEVDEAALVQDEIELMLQVNGKLRGAIRVPADADKAAIEAAALASPEFVKFAEGKRGEEGHRRAGPAGQRRRLMAARAARRRRCCWRCGAPARCSAGCGFELRRAPAAGFPHASSWPASRRARRWPPSCARSIDASRTTLVVDTLGAGRGRAARR